MSTTTIRIDHDALPDQFDRSRPDAVAEVIEAAGGRYIDVAVMAPVHPKRNLVPLLISGPNARDAAPILEALPMALRVVEGPVGRASSIKMVRSVMVKGLEALTAECVLAAVAAGVGAGVWKDVAEAAVAALGLAKAVEGVPAGVVFFLGDLKRIVKGTLGGERGIGAVGLCDLPMIPAKLFLPHKYMRPHLGADIC